jgi:ankyrin repeat protein
MDWKDSVGQTCLHLAAQRGHFEALGELLSRGADVYAGDALGRTVLQLAKQSDRASCARLVELHTSRLPVAHINSEEIQNKKENIDASRPLFRNVKPDRPVVLKNRQPVRNEAVDVSNSQRQEPQASWPQQ